jgi:alkyl hydroperoxide reductase subunit F
VAKDLGGQAVDSTKIENYLGFDFITGPDLTDKFKHHLLHSHYLEHLMSEVEKIEPHRGGFQVTTADLATYTAKALIIATGMTRRRLGVPGEKKFLRKGIFTHQELSFVEVARHDRRRQLASRSWKRHTVARNIHLFHLGIDRDQAVVERAVVGKFAYYLVTRFSNHRRPDLTGVTIRKKAGSKP